MYKKNIGVKMFGDYVKIKKSKLAEIEARLLKLKALEKLFDEELERQIKEKCDRLSNVYENQINIIEKENDRLREEIKELKKQNKNLSLENKSLKRELESYKMLFKEISRELNEQIPDVTNKIDIYL